MKPLSDLRRKRGKNLKGLEVRENSFASPAKEVFISALKEEGVLNLTLQEGKCFVWVRGWECCQRGGS